MAFRDFCTWLQHLEFSTAIGESTWMFPTIETVHVLALTLVVGSISTVDLRLLGLTNKQRSITELTAETLPWTWVAFAVAAVAGLLMFCSKALTYYEDIPFRIKMVCMALAALNMLTFHALTARDIAKWDRGVPPPAVKLAGALSLSLWIAIVAAGRWIGFTT
jgi:hypothetical protein